MSHSKLIDLQERGETPSVPASLDEFLAVMEQELAAFRTLRPVVPLGVVLRLGDGGSRAQRAECLAWTTALADGSREIGLEGALAQRLDDCEPNQRGLLHALSRARRPRCALGIDFDTPSSFPSRPCAVNVLRPASLLSADSISAEWLARARQYDELWVGSAAEASELRRCGLAPERMRVVPTVGDQEGSSLRDQIADAIADTERRLQPPRPRPATADQIRVVWEGELFAGHSFSNVNEHVLCELQADESIALSVQRKSHNPTHDRLAPCSADLLGLVGRELPGEPEITIRHAFPPNWTPPESGRWVHIQPWEFGRLPLDWLPHLRDKVDEIWAPSNYVKRVYVDSGVAADKVYVIPWGVARDVFNPQAPALRLPTAKSFRFLFVGGTIARKGFDRVLEAYLAEFGPDEDVALVVKDSGTRSFYAGANHREQILAAANDPGNPQIIYLDEEFTAGQLASLYTACQALVAPYRGEGFGLPVLEAMACGVVPIVPLGGPTDDFADEHSAYLLAARETENEIGGLSGPGSEFEVSLDELRRVMRAAASDRERTGQLGRQASERVSHAFTWHNTVQRMSSRIQALAGRSNHISGGKRWSRARCNRLAIVVTPTADETRLADCLACVTPFAGAVVVDSHGLSSTARTIAGEYGAILWDALDVQRPVGPNHDWTLWLDADESLAEQDFAALDQRIDLLTDSSQAASVVVRSTDDPAGDRRELRLVRSCGSEGRLLSDFRRFDSAQPVASAVVQSDLVVRKASGGASPNSLLAQNRQWTIRNPTPGGTAVPPGSAKKGVLIQLATGPHLELIEITRAHHRAYAERHGLDYWCVEGNPAAPKRPGWGKIPLILSALEMGFERVVWLDADAVIVDPGVNLSTVIDAGIGLVRHPNPDHWNSGVMVVCRSDEAQRFFAAVNAAPENDSAWMEQLPINQLAGRPEFAGLLTPLDAALNSTPGAVMAPQPIVLAAHGLPHADRRELLAKWIRGVQSSPSMSCDRFEVRTRDDFGELLNRHGLSGQAVEVGVQRGEFARILLDRWRGETLHLVDPWRHLDDYHDIGNLTDAEHEACLEVVDRNLAAHRGRYRLHRRLSAEAVPSFADDSLDFVYIDANHEFSAVLQDIRDWYPKIRPGGVLAGHDYLDGQLPEGDFGVKSAVSQFESESGARACSTSERAWPSWYIIKPSRRL